MAEHQDLDILGLIGGRRAANKTEHPAQQEIQKGEEHGSDLLE